MATVEQRSPLGTTVTLNGENYILLSCEEYEQLLHRPVANSATPVTAYSPGAFVASHGESWMIDLGATTHLTSHRSHFSSLTTSHNSLPVRLADGSYSSTSGSGTVRPTDHITLTNVLFAPKFPVNLLSVSQLTKKHNCSVTFFPSYCVFWDLQTQRMIGGGHERGGLYFLDKSTPADARALSASVSPLQWHCRLGHPSLPSLKKILPIESARLECESCELGKHHRASFPPRIDKRSSSPFTLIHSTGGFRYFITFVDDYSRMTWVYLLKDRSQMSLFFETTAYYSPNSSSAIPTPSHTLPVPALSIPPHIETPTRPLHVYSRRTRPTTTTPSDPPGLSPAAAPETPATSANDLPIALRKGKRSCTAHPLAHSLSYQYLSPNYQAFSASLSSVSIPNTYCEALRHPAWKMAMDDEMSALILRGTWELVEPPPNTDVVACRWVLPSNFGLIGPSTGIKLVWLQRVSLRHMG
ncbi:UNVERIFIED_CONTAM: Retrovirus-related Pol polyprotein from transposon RE2 [Sesamum latifolium]|uniref:Retrovirus-related Pol polyprotein from transposon RE2 n=1 Tax=Sesamum latifolium TaxID=2727402 RepID=A0AAW2WH72_9LAMI